MKWLLVRMPEELCFRYYMELSVLVLVQWSSVHFRLSRRCGVRHQLLSNLRTIYLPGLEPTWFPSVTMVLTNVRELAMLMRISVAKYFGSGSLFCVLWTITLLLIDINITIAINYFVNTNLYFSKFLVVLRFCSRLRVTFYKEVGPLWGHIYTRVGD